MMMSKEIDKRLFKNSSSLINTINLFVSTVLTSHRVSFKDKKRTGLIETCHIAFSIKRLSPTGFILNNFLDRPVY